MSSIKRWAADKYDQTRAKMNQNKKRSLIALTSLTVALGGSGIGYTYYQSQVDTVYHVYVHDQKIGIVTDEDVIYDWLEKKMDEEASKYAHVNLQRDDDIYFEEETLYRPEYDNEAALQALEEQFSLKATAVKVVIDGELIGYVSDEEALSTVIDDYKGQFVSQEFLALQEESTRETKKPVLSVASVEDEEQEDKAVESRPLMQKDDSIVDEDFQLHVALKDLELNRPKMIEAQIKQDIQLETTTVHPSQVISEDELETRVKGARSEEKIYHVQKGDVLGSIASKHDLSLQELLDLNPDLNEDTVLQIDQDIVVVGEEPVLTVETTERLKKEKVIEYETVTEQTSDLYRGERKTKQEGKNGKRLVLFELTKVNGETIRTEEIEEEILEEPVEEIILVGTKEKPSRGSGKFQWPAIGGTLTSGFGQRWGRMHKGIDISGVSDRGILASDNGRVEKAEYHSTYGNLIVINHGNGYKTLYAHLSSMSVSVGDVVKKGERIGVMGTTGRSTGMHLHFEVIRNGTSVNPLRYVGR
ncbi:M23 family metallopeptidase [Caldalkalibacillus salinus]|uniref:M23 family metallopeptidase n=1 Tax=Caldalkalibacillus salinus TaxID=2803787 RepID=UPI001921EE34|nr:M23 family metallopeptidase [Caldalkalibacillus salinus]